MSINSKPIPFNIQNLGAVNNANIELKPLTIFVGENSTGKTYTAYLITYIFSRYACKDFLNFIKKSRKAIKFDEIECAVDGIFNEGNFEFELKPFIKKYSNEYFRIICDDVVPKRYKEFLASDSKIFENIKINLELKNFDEIQYHHLSPHFLHFCYEPLTDQEIKDNKAEKISYKIDENNLIIKFCAVEKKQKRKEIQRFVQSLVFELLHRSIFNEAYFLGAERTGMALFYHTAKRIRKNSEKKQQKDIKEKGEVKPSLSQPVIELYDSIMDIYDPTSESNRKERIRNKKEITQYLEYANILENSILSGNIGIKSEDNDNTKKLIFDYHANNDVKLGMTISSSSVKGLTPLILYLRYFIEPNEIIVIDEPEMNLHPKAQVKLIELLAMLANSKVHILITTHSPYIVDHLMNLIKASRSKNQQKISQKFYLKNKNAFIRKENVSAYLFENNTAIDILTHDGEIDWKTFSRISEEIIDLYFEIDD